MTDMVAYDFYVDDKSFEVFAQDSDGYWFSVWGLPPMSPLNPEEVPDNMRKIL